MGSLDQLSDEVSADSKVFSGGSSQESKTDFSDDEEELIARMHNLVGDRWSLIAGRIPGRTAEEIEKYWIARYSSSDKIRLMGIYPVLYMGL